MSQLVTPIWVKQARKHAELALQARPHFSVAMWGKRLAYKHEDDRQRFLDGLRYAGLPE